LGRRIAVENTTYYTNIGNMSEAAFLAAVSEQADCDILLDLNNIAVNFKNHRQTAIAPFLQTIDLERVSYMHVAGHEFDPRFGLYIDTHSTCVEAATRQAAMELQRQHGFDILLEWDNDIPDLLHINQELQCLRNSMPT
jgi:uncharacterized protein (UPF0276 family)